MSRVSQNIANNIILNPIYSEIFSYLAEFPDNSSGLKKRGVKKAQSVIYRQLKKLEKEYYIKPFDNKRNAFQLNIEKILEDFYLFFKEKMEKNFKFQKNLYSETFFSKTPIPNSKINKKLIHFDKELNFEVLIGEINSIEFKFKLKTNEIFKRYFLIIIKRYNDKTLKEIFEIILDYFIQIDIYDLYLQRLEFFKKKNIYEYLNLLIINNKDLNFHFYFLDILKVFYNKSDRDLLERNLEMIFEDLYID